MRCYSYILFFAHYIFMCVICIFWIYYIMIFIYIYIIFTLFLTVWSIVDILYHLHYTYIHLHTYLWLSCCGYHSILPFHDMAAPHCRAWSSSAMDSSTSPHCSSWRWSGRMLAHQRQVCAFETVLVTAVG